MKKRILFGLLGLILLWAAGSAIGARQLAQRDAALGRPPLFTGAEVPPAMSEIFERSCRDCHSNMTQWPWYAGLPPVSTLVLTDVEKGRKFLNLSKWDQYSPAERIGFLAAMSSSIKTERMPPQPYRLLHWPANLTDADRKQMQAWAKAETKRVIAELRREKAQP